MDENLSEDLHSRLDAMGAPPREQATPPPSEPEMVEDDDDTGDEGLVADDTLDAEQAIAEGQDSEPEGEIEAEGGDEEGGESGETWKVTDFAQAVGLEPDELYNGLTFQVNGETLTLGQMKDRAQGTLPPDIEAQKAEIQQVREQMQREYQQFHEQQQAFTTQRQTVSQEIDDARGQKKAIEIQYSNVDWEKMDQEDPGKAALLRQKFAAAYAQADAQIEQTQKKVETEQQQAFQQAMQHENTRLLEMVPEWRDPNVYQKEGPQISEFLISKGFAPEELQSIYHAGARAIARDAWLWNQHKAQVSQAANKVRKAPKRALRSVRSPSADVLRDKQVQELEQQAILSGRQSDRLTAARGILESALDKRRHHGTRTRSGRR